MKKIICTALLLVSTLLYGEKTNIQTISLKSIAEKKLHLHTSIQRGTKNSGVGMIINKGEEGIISRGPMGFAVSGDGVFILDNVHKRIALKVATEPIKTVAKIPKTNGIPRLLNLQGGQPVMMTNKAEHFRFDKSMLLMKKINITSPQQKSTPFPSTRYHRDRKGFSIIFDWNKAARVRFTDTTLSAAYLTKVDSKGTLYIVIHTRKEGKLIPYLLTAAQDGTVQSKVRLLVDNESVYKPSQQLQIDDNGMIYHMVPFKDHIGIYSVNGGDE